MINVTVETDDRHEGFTVEDEHGLLCFSVPEKGDTENRNINLYAVGGLGLKGIEDIAVWCIEQLFIYFIEQADEDELACVMAEMQALPLYALRRINDTANEEKRDLLNRAWMKMDALLSKQLGDIDGQEE